MQVKEIVCECINLYQIINNKYILFYPANFCEQTVHTFMCLARGEQRESLRRNHSEKWQSGDWFLQHDNGPAHTAWSVQQFLPKNKMVVVSHHPYSPDLALCDFFCTHG